MGGKARWSRPPARICCKRRQGHIPCTSAKVEFRPSLETPGEGLGDAKGRQLGGYNAMSISRKAALERGQQAIERPKGQMALTLYYGAGGLTVRYQGRVIARTTGSVQGSRVAPFVALALGARLPRRGQKTRVTVSSGVLFRVLSICTLDPEEEADRMLLAYLLREADELRGFRSSAVE